MADFCKQCSEKMFGKEVTDKLDFGIKENEILCILCEGCGRQVWVQNDGCRIECNLCKNAEDSVCHKVPGMNFGRPTEISGTYGCVNFERRINERSES